MYINCTFASFEVLLHKFNLHWSSLCQYFQVHHFLQNHDPNCPCISLSSRLDDLPKSLFNSERLVSKINDCKASFKTQHWQRSEQTRWMSWGGLRRGHLGERATKSKRQHLPCQTKHYTIQDPTRIHYSKARLAKIYSNTDASCYKCWNTPADLTHMFWSCPTLATFWSTIFKTLSEALNINLQPNVAMAIFGTTDRKSTTLRKSYKNIIAFTTLLAYKRILLHWK